MQQGTELTLREEGPSQNLPVFVKPTAPLRHRSEVTLLRRAVGHGSDSETNLNSCPECAGMNGWFDDWLRNVV